MLKQLIATLTFCIAGFAFAATDVNKASEVELTTIKGIGPAIATKIVQAREQGPFKNWDDLIARVNGIAATNAQKFSDGGLTINGQALPKASAQVPASKPTPDAKTNEKAGKSSSPS